LSRERQVEKGLGLYQELFGLFLSTTFLSVDPTLKEQEGSLLRGCLEKGTVFQELPFYISSRRRRIPSRIMTSPMITRTPRRDPVCNCSRRSTGNPITNTPRITTSGKIKKRL
jgi:hypothetical protein